MDAPRSIRAVLIASTALVAAEQAPTSPSSASVRTPEYDLAVRVLPAQHRLEIGGTIRLPASDTARAHVDLLLASAMRDLTVRIVQPEELAGLVNLHTVDSAGTDRRYRIVLPGTLSAHRDLLISVTTTGGERGGTGFYVGEEASFATQLTSWYPLAADGERKGIGRLRISVPLGRVAVADEMNLSSESGDSTERTYEFQVRTPTYFVFLEGPFRRFTRPGRVPISAYALPGTQVKPEYLERVSQVVTALEAEFGPYPFRGFTLVGVPRDLLHRSGTDGTAFLGGMVLGSQALDPPDFALALPYVAHEASHQWFPFTVRVVPPGGRYMAEGLAQYGSLRAVASLLGQEAAERYRTHGLPDWGDGDFSAAGYFRYAAAGYDQALADLPEAPDGQRMMYVKGMLVWEMLSRQLGHNRFRRAMTQLTRAHAFTSLTWAQFWSAFERNTGRNLSAFYRQWWAGVGAPSWRVSWTDHGGRLRVSIVQDPPSFDSFVILRAEGFGGERLDKRVRIAGAQTGVAITTGFPVRAVILDPDMDVLHWTDEYRTIAAVMTPVTRASRERLLGHAADLRGAIRSAFAEVPDIDMYGLGFMLHYRLAESHMQAGENAAATREFELALANATRCTDRLPWLYFHLARLAKGAGDESRLRWAVGAAASADSLAGGHSGVPALTRGLLAATGGS